ncbi:hypothetical protein [Longispora urticae]
MSNNETPPTPTTRIVTAMGALGATDARTIAEAAGVPYSTTVRKLREWATDDQISKIDRGKEAAHFTLLDGVAPAGLVSGLAEGDDSSPTDEPDTTNAKTGTTPEPETGSNPLETADVNEVPDSIDVEPVAQAQQASDGQNDDDRREPGPPPALEPKAKGSANPGPEPTVDADGQATAPTDKAGRLQPGVLKEAALKVLRAQPDKAFKVIEVCRLIERAFLADGLGARKASSGAVANALNGYAASGEAERTSDNPATFKAA